MAVRAFRAVERAGRRRCVLSALSGRQQPLLWQARHFADASQSPPSAAEKFMNTVKGFFGAAPPAEETHAEEFQMSGVTYSLDGAVYVALTNEATAELTTMKANGPLFSFPDSVGFQPLPAGKEPTGEQAAQLALRAIGMTDSQSAEVVFEGQGEPLLRATELVAALHYFERHSNKMTVKAANLHTSGLVKKENGAELAFRLHEAGLSKAVVQLQTADPDQYQEMVQPFHGLGHADVCSFVTALVSSGVETEVSAVAKPGVDLAAVEALAKELGASFVQKPYLE